MRVTLFGGCFVLLVVIALAFCVFQRFNNNSMLSQQPLKSGNGVAPPSKEEPLDPTTLPRWNLERHFGYTGAYDTTIDAEMTSAQTRAEGFMLGYRGKVADSMGAAIAEYEKLSSAMSKLEAYLYLKWAVAQTDEKLTTRQSDVKAKINQIRSDNLTFFTLEISKMTDKVVETAMTDETVQKYSSWIENTRAKKPYYLSEEVERALSVRGPWASEEPVTDYLEQQMSSAKFTATPEMLGPADLVGVVGPTTTGQLNLEAVLNKLFSKEQTVRRAALKCLNSGLKSNYINRFSSLSLNMVAGSWHIEMKERNYKNLRSSRNVANRVPDVVVDALLAAVREHGVALSKRYYKLKKQVLMSTSGLKVFTWADRNAPINLGSESDVYSWEEAQSIVREGYKKFSPRMADMFTKMIEEQRVDMPAVDGKRSGAFCHGVVPGVGPFQMNNYIGNKRDVATLAHESGHGCHDILAYKQGYLQYHPPLTLAETASIFGEMIVFRDLLGKASTREERLAMLMGKIDEVINSVVRQCSFDRFEELVHTARQQGQIGDDTFDQLWMQATKEYYGEEGEVIDKYEDMNSLWSYVSHFHVVPFYVYSYAFADLVVGSLYGVYKTTPEGFEDKLLALLEAGSTKDFVTVLKPFGLNPSEPTFWERALKSHLGSLLDEAEQIAVELNLATA
eukprot:GHVS01032755.1.p1 GENE.GHVS01032755.1~~GHVS01032755.1.p1  ORF type:complete len:676 (+),score=94.39 GHVS01032755.1:222-2249(+)